MHLLATPEVQVLYGELQGNDSLVRDERRIIGTEIYQAIDTALKKIVRNLMYDFNIDRI